VCTPDVGAVRVMLAVVPLIRDGLPWAAPSRVNETVPVGVAVLAPVKDRLAVTSSELPPSGVVVAGVMASDVTTLEMVMVTGDEVTAM
jgi:hypothetical protein